MLSNISKLVLMKNVASSGFTAVPTAVQYVFSMLQGEKI